MKLSLLEPSGIFMLAGGLLYSMTIFILNVSNYKYHFIVQTIIIFLALLAIASYKYLKYRYTCEKMDEIIQMMKIK